MSKYSAKPATDSESLQHLNDSQICGDAGIVAGVTDFKGGLDDITLKNDTSVYRHLTLKLWENVTPKWYVLKDFGKVYLSMALFVFVCLTVAIQLPYGGGNDVARALAIGSTVAFIIMVFGKRVALTLDLWRTLACTPTFLIVWLYESFKKNPKPDVVRITPSAVVGEVFKLLSWIAAECLGAFTGFFAVAIWSARYIDDVVGYEPWTTPDCVTAPIRMCLAAPSVNSSYHDRNTYSILYFVSLIVFAVFTCGERACLHSWHREGDRFGQICRAVSWGFVFTIVQLLWGSDFNGYFDFWPWLVASFATGSFHNVVGYTAILMMGSFTVVVIDILSYFFYSEERRKANKKNNIL